MLRRLGGVLILVLGAVLIGAGASDSGGVTIGTPQQSCGLQVGGIVGCPTGTISITETTTVTGNPTVQKPNSWTVTITSANCVDTAGAPLSEIVNVPDGDTASSGQLFLYQFVDGFGGVRCNYDLAVAPAPGFTTAFVPTSPVTIPDGRPGVANVALNATAVAITTGPSTTSVPPTDLPSTDVPSSAPASDSLSIAPTSAADSSSSGGVAPTQASRTDAAPIADTGTNHIGGTLALGIGLVLLGLLLIFETRLRQLFARGGRHTA